MIDPRELRLGNLFEEIHSKEIVEVIELTNEKITFSGDFKGKWKSRPIPLSEEWLLRFGFELGIDEYYKFFPQGRDRHLALSKHKNLWYAHILQAGELSNEQCRIVSIDAPQSVHSLQNLWASITNEELKTKQ